MAFPLPVLHIVILGIVRITCYYKNYISKRTNDSYHTFASSICMPTSQSA